MSSHVRDVVLGCVLVGAVGCWALPVAATYVAFLVPMSLVDHLGPTWYFGLVSALAGIGVGVVAGCGSYPILRRAQLKRVIGVASLPLAAYLAFALYVRGASFEPGSSNV
jgi:hypothetical protein